MQTACKNNPQSQQKTFNKDQKPALSYLSKCILDKSIMHTDSLLLAIWGDIRVISSSLSQP